jgi:hypothetical protein
LATGFTGFATTFVAGFLAAGLAFASISLDLAVAALVGEDLIVFPLVGALVALAFALSLGATVFFTAVAEDLAGFKAMRTYSFYQVDRYKISGITKTHVKSVEMTGSYFDYATKFLVYGTTEQNGGTGVETYESTEVFPKAKKLSEFFFFPE